jgi:hypothetical protein
MCTSPLLHLTPLCFNHQSLQPACHASLCAPLCIGAERALTDPVLQVILGQCDERHGPVFIRSRTTLTDLPQASYAPAPFAAVVARSRYVAVAQEVLNNIVGRLLDDVADVPADSSSGVNSGARPPVSWSVNASSVVSSNNLMASSTACAIAATASPTLEELTAELKGLPPSPHHLCGIPLNDCRQPSRVPPRSLSLVVHPCQLLPFRCERLCTWSNCLAPLKKMRVLGAKAMASCLLKCPTDGCFAFHVNAGPNCL